MDVQDYRDEFTVSYGRECNLTDIEISTIIDMVDDEHVVPCMFDCEPKVN